MHLVSSLPVRADHKCVSILPGGYAQYKKKNYRKDLRALENLLIYSKFIPQEY